MALPAKELWFQDRLKALSGRVRDMRESFGWSMQDLADRAGISPATVWDVETATPARVEAYTVLALASAMHCTPDYLWGLDPLTAHQCGMVSNQCVTCPRHEQCKG